MHTPQGIRTEILLSNGSWQAIPTKVRGADAINITRGRKDMHGRTNTSVSLTLEDHAGDFNDLNPRSPYYGLIGPNTRLRVSTGRTAPLEDNFTRTVSGSWSGGSFTWTDSPGGADWDVDGASGTHTHPDTNVLRYSTADAGEPNHRVRGAFRLSVATLTGANASVWILGRFTDTSNYYAARISLETDGDITIALHKRVAGVLTAVGDTVAWGSAADFSTVTLVGELYVEGSKLSTRIFQEGTAEPAGWTIIETDMSLTTGNRVGVADRRETGNTNGNLIFAYSDFLAVPGCIRCTVEVPNFGASRWTPGGFDVTMPIQGAGIKRRLGAGGATVLRSPMVREITRGDIVPLVGYWPMEEAAKVTQIASGLSGGKPMNIVGSEVTFGATSPFAGAASLVTLGAGVSLVANNLAGTDTGTHKAGVIMTFPDAGLVDQTPLLMLMQAKDASVRKWYLVYTTGGGLRLIGYNQAFTLVEDTGSIAFAVNGKSLWVSLVLAQDGADVDWAINTYEPASDGSVTGAGSSGTFTTSSVGGLTDVSIAPTGAMTGCSVGQLAVANEQSILGVQNTSLIAHIGETSTERFARLCDEERVAYEIVGIESSASSVQMGPQRIGTLQQNLDDVEDAEGGIVYEPRHFLGLTLRTSETIYNQTGPAFDYEDGHLTAEPFPVPDDRQLANDVTAVRPDGSLFQSVEESGPMSILEPPEGIGRYDRRVPVPVRNAVDLPDIARWHRHLGTWRGPRYPTIQFDTHRAVFVADATLSNQIDELEPGDFFSVDNPPVWLPPERIDVLAQGYIERIQNMTREIQFNAIDAAPYVVARRDSNEYRDSAATVLNEALDTTETGVDVAVTGPLWVTGSVDFDIMVGGELMSVSSISGSSSPQTLGVTRSVNGIVKTHSVGAEVHVYPIPRRALTSVNFNASVPSDDAASIVVGRDTPPTAWAEGEGTGIFTSSAYVQDTIPVGVAFTVPSTGAVIVYIAGEMGNTDGTGNTYMSFNVRSTSEIGGGSLYLAALDNRAIKTIGTDSTRIARAFRLDGANVPGLLAGREYNICLAHRRVTAGNATISRRMILVMPDKVQGGAPGSLIDAEPASVDDFQDTLDTTVSTSFTTADMTPCGASFVAPPSGKVMVRLSARVDNSGANSTLVSFRIGTGGTVGAGTEVVAAAATRCLEVLSANERMGGATFPVTGLTPADTYNVQLMHRVTAGTGSLESRYVCVQPVA